MAIIGKVVTNWAGTSGGPGLTQLYIEDTGSAPITGAQAQSAVNAVRAFWDTIKAYMPDDVVLTVGTVVDMYDPADGELVQSVSAATGPASVQGTSAAVFSMAAGFKVNLQTQNIRNGRRVRGSIYVVPAASTAMGVTGAVASATRTAVNAAGATLISALATANLNLIVWGRPVVDDAGTVTRVGTVNYVLTTETNEKSCILRGRRD